MDLDWTRIAQRLLRRGLSNDQAWSAIGQAYISYISNPPATVNSTNELAEYFYLKCIGWHFSWLTQPCAIEKAVANKDSEIAKRSTDGPFAEDELFESPEVVQDDVDYVSDLLKLVPQSMRIPTLIVVQAILKRPPTKPLTVEACRKILQKAKVCNTSEYARQVYTFLTTLKR